jgi:hypothetical protein
MKAFGSSLFEMANLGAITPSKSAGELLRYFRAEFGELYAGTCCPVKK